MSFKVIDIVEGLSKREGQYGVEVEISGENLPRHDPLPGWRWDSSEGSIGSSGREYVFDQPLMLDRSINAVRGLYETLSSTGRLYESNRCGIHVHYNCQQLTTEHLLRICAVYTMMEPFLLQFCGETRKGNRFCVPWNHCPSLIDTVASVLEAGGFPSVETNLRYSALNLDSLSTFGSIEFRAMRTPTSPDDAIKWIEAIEYLTAYAKRTPKQELTEVIDPVGLAHSLFPQLTAEIDSTPEADVEIALVNSFMFSFTKVEDNVSSNSTAA